MNINVNLNVLENSQDAVNIGVLNLQIVGSKVKVLTSNKSEYNGVSFKVMDVF